MWFKKKSVLKAEGHYNTEKSADNTTDLRTTWKAYYTSGSITASGLPSASDAGNYFYLPALGMYYSGQLYYIGSRGIYWSSSAAPGYSNNACNLYFTSGGVVMNVSNSYFGYRVGPTFE